MTHTIHELSQTDCHRCHRKNGGKLPIATVATVATLILGMYVKPSTGILPRETVATVATVAALGKSEPSSAAGVGQVLCVTSL